MKKFKFIASGTCDAYPVENLYNAYPVKDLVIMTLLLILHVLVMWWNQNLENSCLLLMIRKCLYDGSDDDNDDGTDDNKISFYKVFEGTLR